MAQETILSLSGGMNQDDAVSAVPSGQAGNSAFTAGDYRYGLNIRIGNTAVNNTGSGENLPSSIEVSSYLVWSGTAWVAGTAPSGVNTSLNKYEDRSEGQIYWAVHNSEGNHLILKFNKSERKIYELLKWSGLNFSLTNFVSMTKINKYLILTDGDTDKATGNPPRIIDVTDIYKLFATLTSSNFSEFHISFAKWAPVSPPLIKGSADFPNGNIFIKKGQYQFIYRYVYKGGFRSCWSPPSPFVSNLFKTVLFPSLQEADPTNFDVFTYGFLFDYNNPDNTAFNHTDARFSDFIESIEYAYRDSENHNWKVFVRNTINSGDSPFIAPQTFFNNGDIYTVAPNQVNQYFDSVPLLSASVEAIDNRPMFGNNLDDLPPLENLIITNVEVYSADLTQDQWYYESGVFLIDPNYQRFSFKENGVYRLGIIFKDYTGRSGLVQTTDNWIYTIPSNKTNKFPVAQEYIHALGFKIDPSVVPPVWAVDYQIVRTNCLNMDLFIVGQVNDFIFIKGNYTTNQAGTTPSEIRDAIASYYDAFNTGASQYSITSRILSAIRNNQATTVGQASFIYMDIRTWALDAQGFAPGGGVPEAHTNNVFYNWQPGDRVRFWASTNSNFGGPYTQHDEVIVEYTGTAIIVGIPDNFKDYMGTRASVLAVESPSNIITKLFNIEVYRPVKNSQNQEVIYYEMGEWYPILKPTTDERAFSKTDFTWTNQASVVDTTVALYPILSKYPITRGDVWLVTKNFYYDGGTLQTPPIPFRPNSIFNGPVFPQMNPDPSNAGGQWEHNTGRPLVAYNYIPKQFTKSTQIRFGGKFLEDSVFIGINNFQDDNQKIYPSEYGKIRAMVNTSNTQVKDVGQILMVICEEETMDVYVNRATLQSLNGTTNVTLSDQVLGSYNTLIGSYGTLNPESVSKKNSRVLYWNAKRGMWIRRSTDGLTPISNVKMQNWFKDLSKLLIDTYSTETPATALSVFDPYYEEWVTYLNHSSLPSTFRGYSSYKCAGFDEDDKRWKTIYDFAPQVFAALENETYSIIGTVVHIHYAGTDYGSFYGVKKDVMWQPVANTMYRTTKVWRALNEQSTDKWSVEMIGDYVSNGGTMQESTLLLENLEDREGTFWADIKRDENTVNVTNAIVDGSPMRSRALTLLLTLDPAVTWYSFINWLVVTFDLSEKTAK